MFMPKVMMSRKGPIGLIQLNRPEVRNALDAELIEGLEKIFLEMASDPTLRVAILSGNGESFCAGADLNWMKSDHSGEAQAKEAQRFANCLNYLNHFSKPLIVQVHGVVMGGGVGLASVGDIVVAGESTRFALSEVKVGLVPAIVAPYVIAKIGESAARHLFLTGEKFGAVDAVRYGLAHEVVAAEKLETRSLEIAEGLLSSGPEAIRICKELIHEVTTTTDRVSLEAHTVKILTLLRGSPEAAEGIRAFLEKRKPSWLVARSS